MQLLRRGLVLASLSATIAACGGGESTNSAAGGGGSSTTATSASTGGGGGATTSSSASSSSMTATATSSASSTASSTASSSSSTGAGGGPLGGDFCSSDGWCWSTPTPHGNDLYAAWADAPGKLWALGSVGTIARFDNGTWTQAASPTHYTLRGAWGASATDAWAVGDKGTILHFDGASWQSVTGPTSKTLYAVWGSDPNDVWATGDSIVLHKDAQGWTIADLGTVNVTLVKLEAVWGRGPKDVYVGGATYGGYMIHYDGQSWSYSAFDGSSNLGVRGIWGDATRTFAVTDSTVESLFELKNGFWTKMAASPFAGLQSLVGIGSEAWAIGDNAAMHYDGSNWTAETGGDNSWLMAIAGTSASDLRVVGLGGRVLEHAGGGWSPITAGPSQEYESFGAIFPIAAKDVWAVGHYGRMGHWDGSTWTLTQFDVPFDHNGVWASATNDVWVVSSNGAASCAFQHFDGNSWSTAQTGPYSLSGIWGSAKNDIWAIGEGSLYHYDGASWKLAPDVTAVDSLYGISGSAANDVWVVGDNSLTMHFDGKVWSRVPGPAGNLWLQAVWAHGTKDAWVVDYAGNAHHWDGTGWTTMATGTWQWLSGVWGTGTNDVWAVGGSAGGYGEIMHWDGFQWTESWSGDGVGLGAVGGLGANDIWVVGGNGGILHHL